MMWADYYSYGFETTTGHEVFLEDTTVTCNFLTCEYTEEFDNMDDAIAAMEIHGEATKSSTS